jgi:hypothetical protein
MCEDLEHFILHIHVRVDRIWIFLALFLSVSRLAAFLDFIVSSISVYSYCVYSAQFSRTRQRGSESILFYCTFPLFK